MLIWGMTQAAQASVVLAGTRVVYNAAEPEATLRLSNEGKSPALVQAWIDDGNAKANPEALDVPFTIAPPVARIDPGKAQTLRISYTGEPLPQDRESVFWLNVLEIPPKAAPDEEGANKLQLAFRSRIKLFFRPAGLKGRAEEAPAQLGWRLVQAKGHPAVEVSNPTPYNVTLASFDVVSVGKKAESEESAMVRPGEKRLMPLKGNVPAGETSKVIYRFINDYGGETTGEAPLQAPQ
ncbi:fimbria/pilus periplasmic chaperone [Jeongeupia sp. USM3]|uniref:fimbria/pilus periplasmic chaperone n=1 Tax=Jeongeupia sp. USM3 TaxID=1906741 RepID=UPI00196B4827|nr:fimbria/pilus periplasmic chaperone [Jeongeupia sp. USM3]